MRAFTSASIGLALLSIVQLAGCSAAAPDCEFGRIAPEDALTAFLSAAHDDDPTAAQQTLKPGFSIDNDRFEVLHEALKNESVKQLKYTNAEQASTAYSYRVLSGAGRLVGTFEVHELSTGCFATVWGRYEEPKQDAA